MSLDDQAAFEKFTVQCKSCGFVLAVLEAADDSGLLDVNVLSGILSETGVASPAETQACPKCGCSLDDRSEEPF